MYALKEKTEKEIFVTLDGYLNRLHNHLKAEWLNKQSNE